MREVKTFLLFVTLVVFPRQYAAESIVEMDWQHYFSEYDADGTIVILDQRNRSREDKRLLVFNPERAATQLSPASTYKIPHALFALDSGVIADEFQVFPWDGVVRSYAPQNQDQDLRGAIRNSALWVFEIIAAEIGESETTSYLNEIDYGNTDPSSAAGAYWG